MDFARSVWARWDAEGRRERAEEFLRENAALVARYEALAPREDLRIDMGFLPAPVDLATAGRFRLTEFALHSWDVRVGFDPGATLAADATALIVPVTNRMAGMLGKPEMRSSRQAAITVTTTGPDSEFALRLGETLSVGDEAPAHPDGTLSLPAEAWVRLATGRLGPAYTPAGVTATGAADLDVLRAVFPGF